MKGTQPSVFLIARPTFDWEAIAAYLAEVGGASWMASDVRTAPPGEVLTEFAGRLCYRSWAPGLNANVSKIRRNRASYIDNLLSSGHGSVLEHAQYTFVFHDVSRVFTHELVRHRAGVAISQESLRFVRLTDIKLRIPDVLEPLRAEIVHLVEVLEEFQRVGAHRLRIDEPDVPFAVKKEVTSALRRLAPLGLSTDVVWSANVRALRHVITMRTAAEAEEEMRLVFDRVAALMVAECPLLFSDFTRRVGGHWEPKHLKV